LAQLNAVKMVVLSCTSMVLFYVQESSSLVDNVTELDRSVDTVMTAAHDALDSTQAFMGDAALPCALRAIRVGSPVCLHILCRPTYLTI
jgi:hypothetical protein